MKSAIKDVVCVFQGELTVCARERLHPGKDPVDFLQLLHSNITEFVLIPEKEAKTNIHSCHMFSFLITTPLKIHQSVNAQ